MRGFAYFLAYTIGVSAVITLFIISLMALEKIDPTNTIRANHCGHIEQASRYSGQAYRCQPQAGKHQTEA